MRWIWIDKIVEFEPGRRAAAIKNVSRAEECLRDRFGGGPVLPPTLMIEGVAQTAGILIGETRGFRENVILAKIRRAEFHDFAGPGDQLRYDAVIDSLDDRAAVSIGTVSKNGATIGSVELMFSRLDQASRDLGLPDHSFVFSEDFMELFRSFQAGVTGGGEDTHGG